MSDLIRKEDAIEAIEVVDWYHQNRNKDMVSGANSDEHQAWYKAEDVYKALEAVPSADTEIEIIKAEAYAKGIDSERKRISDWCRPSGEWIDDDFVGQYRCSECDYYAIDEYDYCPNCGCRMKDVTEGLESRTDLIWYGDKIDLIGDETGRHTGWFGKGADDE